MKVRNLNNSSVKTRRLIKNTFIKMLSEKKEISKISVSELVARADISRATFYAHFDDIYGVVEEFETELIDKFFTNAKFSAKRLTTLGINKLLELINNDANIRNRDFIEMEISVFLEGLICEYVKYCRNLTSVTPSDLYAYSKEWYKKFMKERCF